VLSGIKPPEKPESLDESTLRPALSQIARDIMDRVAAGGPEWPGTPGPPARDDPEAMVRLEATFVDSHDGWADDQIALAQPWGFAMPNAVPVGIWFGTRDTDVPTNHAQWLLANIPGAQSHQYPGAPQPFTANLRVAARPKSAPRPARRPPCAQFMTATSWRNSRSPTAR
jgi:hypothetical protein